MRGFNGVRIQYTAKAHYEGLPMHRNQGIRESRFVMVKQVVDRERTVCEMWHRKTIRLVGASGRPGANRLRNVASQDDPSRRGKGLPGGNRQRKGETSGHPSFSSKGVSMKEPNEEYGIAPTPFTSG